MRIVDDFQVLFLRQEVKMRLNVPPTSCPPPPPPSSVSPPCCLENLFCSICFDPLPPPKKNRKKKSLELSPRGIEGLPEAEVEEILEDGDIFFEAVDALRDKATTILRRSLVTCPSGFWLNLLGPGSTSSTEEDIVYPVYIVSWVGFFLCL